jgi:hypothetical protein
MKIIELLRGILDFIDQESQPKVSVNINTPDSQQQDPELLARMLQLAGLESDSDTEYSNSPDEKVSSVDAVTASGTDLQKSKHPADIRTNAPSMYPFAQWKDR